MINVKMSLFLVRGDGVNKEIYSYLRTQKQNKIYPILGNKSNI